MNKILIFVPMYNCEKQISRVIKKISDLKEKQRYFTEILIVDNGSGDKSCEVAIQSSASLSAKLTLIKNKNNILLGGSHKVAFNYALANGYDYVLVLHGDDQGDINDIVPYVENGRYRDYDSFLGSRFHKDSKLKNYSKFRIFGNRLFNIIISAVAGKRLSDMGSGLNIYNVDYLRNRFYLKFPDNLTFNVYLLLYGVYSKSRFDFFPLTWREEDQKSNAKLISQSVEIFKLAMRYCFFRNKLFSFSGNEFPVDGYEYSVIFKHNFHI
jgi:glycosyltransferase involved in cell wall biosynthesis